MSSAPQIFHCDFAWLGGERAEPNVELTVQGNVINSVVANAPRNPAATVLPGLTMPGLANTHSHVFHRAIRGHTQAGFADFWQWRSQMYNVAAQLDPDSLYELARATFAEMLLSGATSVGEFFYVHHRPDGSSYDDPNAMGLAAVRAAVDVGLRITLLDTLYLQGGVGGELVSGAQVRYSDGSRQAWAQRVEALREAVAGEPLVTVGAAIHSVRAVPAESMGPVADFCRKRGMPLHAHVSEQPAENADCVAVYGMTPIELLASEGVLGPNFTAVHATHLTDNDIRLLGDSGSAISMCCTTERDLADGVGPAVQLLAAGSPLCVGSDGHMMIDLWEEGRAIELNERLISGQRGHLSTPEIAAAISVAGQRAIGWSDTGLAAGGMADFVSVDLDSVRTAGARAGDVLAHVLFSASAADVHSVVVAGRQVVAAGAHVAVPDVGAALNAAIAPLLVAG